VALGADNLTRGRSGPHGGVVAQRRAGCQLVRIADQGAVDILRSVVLPAYNEADYVAEMIANTLAAGAMRPDPFEVIVVDNASSDGTAAIVEGISASEPNVQLVRHTENRLYAGSCLSGTRAARGERIFILDADGQHPPTDIWAFDKKLDEGFDLVFGWRQERQEPFRRILVSKLFLYLTRTYLGFPLHDINCGIRGFNRAFADQMEIRHRVNLVNPELYVRAKLGHFRIGEVAVVQEMRKAGSSTHEFTRPWSMFRQVNTYLRSLRQELR
jgi:glycosyltransferase involved in cell wall biosynthesis